MGSDQDLSAPLSVEEIQEACEFTVQLSAETFNNPHATRQERLRVLGDYLICSSFKGVVSRQLFRERYIQGLEEAGVEAAVIEKLREPGSAMKFERIIFSLRYIPEDETVPGIKRTKRGGLSIDETEFVRGIIERKTQADQS